MQSKIEFLEFVEKTNSTTKTDELFLLLEGSLADLGYDRFVYSLLTDHASLGKKAGHGEFINYPDDWFQHYLEKRYVHLDPVIKYAGQYRGAFLWGGLEKSHRLSAAEKNVLSEGRDAGLLDGVGIPIHGMGGELAGFGIASSSGGVDANKDQLSLLFAVANQFHLAYGALHKNSAQAQYPPPALTIRELEVIKWCAMGKSNWDIAKILSISEHGVEYHIRNIFKKFEVNSRVAAVVKALRFGFIDDL